MQNCTQCNAPLVLKPAGVAKASGEPYSAFWACSSGQRHQQAKAQFKPHPSQPDGFVVLGETLLRMEKKLDWIMGIIEPKKETSTSNPISRKLAEPETMQSLKEVLASEIPVVEDIDPNEISVKDIPF